MRPSRTLALILGGAVRATPFARFLSIGKLVTHVWAPTFRQSVRVSNGMYFARGCRTFEEASEASVLLICDEKRAWQVAEAELDWRRKIVLLALRAPEALGARFRERGASVALVTALDELTPCQFLVEGDEAATTVARQMFESVRGEVSVTAPGSRPHIEAMRILTGPVLMSVLEAADRNVRRTSLPLDAVRNLVGRAALETLRIHQRSNARTWRAPDPEHLERTLLSLRRSDPKLADHLGASESQARALLKGAGAKKG